MFVLIDFKLLRNCALRKKMSETITASKSVSNRLDLSVYYLYTNKLIVIG